MDEWEPSDGSYPPEVRGPFTVALMDWEYEMLSEPVEFGDGVTMFFPVKRSGIAHYALVQDEVAKTRRLFVPLDCFSTGEDVSVPIYSVLDRRKVMEAIERLSNV